MTPKHYRYTCANAICVKPDVCVSVSVSVILTGRVASASFRQQLCVRRTEPEVCLSVKDFDLVAVDLIVGVERPKAIRPATKHKHLRPDNSGRVEVPPARRRALEVTSNKPDQDGKTTPFIHHTTKMINYDYHFSFCVQLNFEFIKVIF